ncbi:MAG TPA: hypothetical protein VK308_12125, partial [Pyrinomonadaceae bacterium]|nr:hypothetical protein [Pyrinomonadaceae bacterium]
MKTIFRNLGFGALMTGVALVSGTTALAQDVCAEVEAKQALYAQFTANFDKKEIEKRKVAVDAGKQYVQKYGACEDDKAIVTYLNQNVPPMEKAIRDAEVGAARNAILVRFDTAAKSKNVPETLSSGREILNRESDFADVVLDVNVALATAGFEQAIAATPVDTYNADTVNYAKSAIQRIESGKTSKNWGVWSYNIKPADKTKFSDEKSYALGALNYMVGYVTYFREGKNSAEKKKEALPYFYKSVQYNSFSKTDPAVYQAIGAWYLDEAIKIDKERQRLLV